MAETRLPYGISTYFSTNPTDPNEDNVVVKFDKFSKFPAVFTIRNTTRNPSFFAKWKVEIINQGQQSLLKLSLEKLGESVDCFLPEKGFRRLQVIYFEKVQDRFMSSSSWSFSLLNDTLSSFCTFESFSFHNSHELNLLRTKISFDHWLLNAKMKSNAAIVLYGSLKLIFRAIPASPLSLRMADMLNAQTFYDCTIRCEGKDIRVYKGLLSSYSAVFAAMFASQMLENNSSELTIHDLDYETVKQMVEHCYTNLSPPIEEAYNLYIAACKYQVESLQSWARTALIDALTVANACEILITADMHSDISLKDEAKTFILQNAAAVKKTDGWKKMESLNSLLAEI